jgi:hypothetical protein
MRENLFFEDVTIGNVITLDIDIFVDDWLLLEKERFLHRLEDLEVRFKTKVQAWYRNSSNNNVHIKIEFEGPLSMLECLLFRAWFDDDQTLLFIDMKRYFKTMDKVNRFMRRFDCKGKINDAGEYEITHAGTWIRVY